MKHENTTTSDFQLLLQLPKDKEVLDYVLKKLGETSSPEKHEVLTELLEMYRTSQGFDPASLSKGRFKRIKASAFRAVLTEINEELQRVVNTQDYKNILKQRSSIAPLFNDYVKLADKLEKDEITSEMETEIKQFKKRLIELEEYELLLSFYRSCQHYYLNNHLQKKAGEIIEEYKQVMLMAELNSEHFLNGLRTLQLVSEAENGNRNHAELINLYDNLCKLLIRQSSTRMKYETLLRIIKVAEHLDNRSHYMEPYIEYTFTHFEEIAFVLPDVKKELNVTLAKYMNRETLPVRMEHLNRAIEEAKNSNSLEDLASFKIVQAGLLCDEKDFVAALKALDETDYIISKAARFYNIGAVKLKSAFTRFSIFAWLTMNGSNKIEHEIFEDLLAVITEAGQFRRDIHVRIVELSALLDFISGKFNDAKTSFIKAVKHRENQSDPLFYLIDSFYQELLRKNPDYHFVRNKITQLQNLRESFYSTLWVDILRHSLKVRQEAVLV